MHWLDRSVKLWYFVIVNWSVHQRMLEGIPRRLAELLGVSPGKVRVRYSDPPGPGEEEVDLVLGVGSHRFAVEYKADGTAAPISTAVRVVRAFAGKLGKKAIPMVVTPFMGEVGRQLCAESGVSWMDLSGNASIEASGLRIHVKGQPNQFKRRGRPRSLFAPKSARIAHWLLLHPERAFAQRELSQAVGMSEGFVSRIVRGLEEQELVVREPGGAVRARDYDVLLDAWREVYDFSKHTIIRGHIAARQHLITIYESQKDWNRASGNTVVLLEFEPKNADLHLFLSQMYMNMNQFDDALREAEKASQLRPGSAAVYLHQAMLAEKADKKKEAIEYYKQAVKLDKKNHVICNTLAMLLEKQGNRKEAITYYKQAVELNPSNVGYHTNLADAYEKDGQLQQAAAAYEALVALDKKNKKAWEALAVLQERTKNQPKALAAYQALNGLEPKNIFWLQKIAALHEQLGNIAKARDTYKAVLDIDPKHTQARQKYVDLSKRLVKK